MRPTPTTRPTAPTRSIPFLATAVAIVLTMGGCLHTRTPDASTPTLPAGASSFTGNAPLAAPDDRGSLHAYGDVITDSLLSAHLMVFASDEMEGRETGTAGEWRAAQWLSRMYASLQLIPMGPEGGYLQPFALTATVTDSLEYVLRSADPTPADADGQDGWRWVSKTGADAGPGLQLAFGGSDSLSGSIVFAGFGVRDEAAGIDELAEADLGGKWVMVFDQIPYRVDGEDLVSRTVTNSVRIGGLLSAGATGVLLISDAEPEMFDRNVELGHEILSKPTNLRLAYRGGAGFRGYGPAVVNVRHDLAAGLLDVGAGGLTALRDSLIGAMRQGAALSARELGHELTFIPHRRETQVESQNVVALLEGSDPELRNEYVVLSSHYDHIGITLPDSTGDRINNGADDDGSGTIGLVAAATAFSEAAKAGYRPKRSIVFLNVSGEEKGLLGSRYYSDHPLLPIESTIANLNADMIGRSDPAHLAEGVTDYVYVIGGSIISSGLDSLVQVANEKSSRLLLDDGYNDLNDPNQFYRRSDHWNFGRLGVPFAFFFTGVHEDYHRPSDEPHKIDYRKLSLVSRLLFASAVELADHPERPVVDNQAFIEATRRQPR